VSAYSAYHTIHELQMAYTHCNDDKHTQTHTHTRARARAHTHTYTLMHTHTGERAD